MTEIMMLVLAFVVEGGVEYVFGTLFDKIPKLTPYKWSLIYFSLAAGIALAFGYRLDIVSTIANGMVNISSAVDMSMIDKNPATIQGMIVTGVIIGRGSNYVHQFISTFFPAPKTATV